MSVRKGFLYPIKIDSLSDLQYQILKNKLHVITICYFD